MSYRVLTEPAMIGQFLASKWAQADRCAPFTTFLWRENPEQRLSNHASQQLREVYGPSVQATRQLLKKCEMDSPAWKAVLSGFATMSMDL